MMQRCNRCGRIGHGWRVDPGYGRVCADRVACDERLAIARGQLTLTGVPTLVPVTQQLRIGSEA